MITNVTTRDAHYPIGSGMLITCGESKFFSVMKTPERGGVVLDQPQRKHGTATIESSLTKKTEP